jgi:hypothetical protein
MKQQEQPRKLRENLTKEELERLAKFGSVEFTSARPAWDPGSVSFIPSREQH